MNRSWLVALALLAAIAQPGVALAEDRPAVMVVVEGANMAAELRTLLAEQLDLKVISPTEAGRGVQPDAVLALRYGSTTGLALSYVDRHGQRESLTIKAPNANALLDLAYGTATAVLSRHLPTLNVLAAAPDIPASYRSHQLATIARSVQLRIRDARSVRITALPLRVEDF